MQNITRCTVPENSWLAKMTQHLDSLLNVKKNLNTQPRQNLSATVGEAATDTVDMNAVDVVADVVVVVVTTGGSLRC